MRGAAAPMIDLRIDGAKQAQVLRALRKRLEVSRSHPFDDERPSALE